VLNQVLVRVRGDDCRSQHNGAMVRTSAAGRHVLGQRHDVARHGRAAVVSEQLLDGGARDIDLTAAAIRACVG
jgi:hypothetical protein